MRLQAFRALCVASVLFLGTATLAHAQLRVQTYVSGLTNPVAFVQDPSDPAVQYVVEQAGRIRVINGGALLSTPFLTVSGIVAGGEQGLLGLAFPPNYGASGQFYIFYTRTAEIDTYGVVVARVNRSAGNRFVADPASRFPLVWSGGLDYVPHFASNHNAGCLAFGADGMLYIAMGDGGGGGDPNNNGQNTSSLLGKILRIDVTSAAAQASASGFVVPAGNPGFPRPEIWSYGLRNPWRFSFDLGTGGTGAMVIGDVGQGAREEIDYEPANRPGRNYGWRYREGRLPYTGTPPSGTVFTEPVWDYDRTAGRSVTGGYVYRGAAIPAMRGRYIFGDYATRRIWSIALSLNGAGEATASGLIDHTAEVSGGASFGGGISSFGVDAAGEVYVVDHSRGLVLKFVPAGPRPPTNVRVVR
jgi:glucose/arabinose dehydrogenase